MSTKIRGSVRHQQQEVTNPDARSWFQKSSDENFESSTPAKVLPQVSSDLRPVHRNPGAYRIPGPGWEGNASFDEGTVQIGSEGPSVVTDESQQYIPATAIFEASRQAPIEPEASSDELSRKRMILVGAFVVLIVCGAIILGVVFGVRNKDKPPAPSSVSNTENSPSPAPTLQPTETMSPTTNKNWIEAGQIQASNGASLALSPSGNQAAVMDSTFGLGTGGATEEFVVVRVYQEEGRSWSQIGNAIDVPSANTSLSLLGNRLAVGDAVDADVGVSVYELQENVWQKIGDNIDGEGWNVKLAQDGSVVAVEEADKVQLYYYNGNEWAEKAASIPTASTRTNMGSSYSRMDVSSDGKTVIVDQTVYTFSDDLDFYYAGKPDPLMESSPPGTPVSMSQDGKVVAIAQFQTNVNGTKSGKVVVFRNIGQPEWKQEGEAISNAVTNGQFGWSHSLSGNGTRIVIMNNPLSGENNKAVVLTLRGSSWVDVLEEIPLALKDSRVSISEEGDRVAIGSKGIVAFYDIVG